MNKSEPAARAGLDRRACHELFDVTCILLRTHSGPSGEELYSNLFAIAEVSHEFANAERPLSEISDLQTKKVASLGESFPRS